MKHGETIKIARVPASKRKRFASGSKHARWSHPEFRWRVVKLKLITGLRVDCSFSVTFVKLRWNVSLSTESVGNVDGTAGVFGAGHGMLHRD